ncbi:MAG TPA: bifunctional enoyl-CoA hydratase/phosphate acetyltransferase [Candidatus Eremiobacteraeota bacterium]|nr:MAG: Phosphate acetyltransferase [bacterium ADurb.Bin363]HPZ06817.1 bifunctional enoyl-CoA hydratase/phosphate acetyltransferase [Candidatus Eremiobacteraeota bacterium]
MLNDFKDVINKVKGKDPKKIVVVKAEDKEIFKAALEAKSEGLADFILVGDEEKIKAIAKSNDFDLSCLTVINQKDEKKALLESLILIRSDQAHILMKGKISTGTLLKGILDKETGLRGNRILSHCLVGKISNYDRFIFVTDGGMNLNPDLKMKVDILNNAIELANKFDIEKPNVAVLSAVETINFDLPETIDAATLSKMAQRGQIKDCILDGPVAIDLALSSESAEIKGVNTPIAGKTDIFLVPNITVGNVLGKSLLYIAQGQAGGIILGARAPVVMLSRSDNASVRLNSIALGVMMCM